MYIIQYKRSNPNLFQIIKIIKISQGRSNHRMNFKFELTKEQAQPILEPVFRGIYQLTDGNMEIFERWISAEKGDLFADPSYQLESDLIIKKHIRYPLSNVWIIRFRVNPKQTIIGVLPNTIWSGTDEALEVTYTPRQDDIYDEILDRLDDLKQCDDEMKEANMFEPFKIDVNELEDVITRLVMKMKLSKYYRVFDDVYLVVYKEIPVFIDVSNDYLNVDGIGDLMFDIGDGFVGDNCGLVVDELNKVFRSWKKAGNIMEPVIPDNVI